MKHYSLRRFRSDLILLGIAIQCLVLTSPAEDASRFRYAFFPQWVDEPDKPVKAVNKLPFSLVAEGGLPMFVLATEENNENGRRNLSMLFDELEVETPKGVVTIKPNGMPIDWFPFPSFISNQRVTCIFNLRKFEADLAKTIRHGELRCRLKVSAWKVENGKEHFAVDRQIYSTWFMIHMRDNKISNVTSTKETFNTDGRDGIPFGHFPNDSAARYFVPNVYK